VCGAAGMVVLRSWELCAAVLVWLPPSGFYYVVFVFRPAVLVFAHSSWLVVAGFEARVYSVGYRNLGAFLCFRGFVQWLFSYVPLWYILASCLALAGL
jgi:hypothetical protein